MAYTGSIENGMFTGSYTKTELDGKITKTLEGQQAGGNLDKEAFLQLLVAQMQYQDPLEPTDNTEYISQLANFSSLEQMQNMSSSLANMSAASDLQRATSLIGKYVTVDNQGANVSGRVDTVEIKDGEAFLSIGGTSYPLSALKEAVDTEYLNASVLSAQFTEAIKNLPSIDDITIDDQNKLSAIRNSYNQLSEYQKSYIDQKDYATFMKYEEKMAQLIAAEKEKEAEEPSKEEPVDEGGENEEGGAGTIISE